MHVCKALRKALSIILALPVLSSHAQAQAVLRLGTCPSGYHASGGACLPTSRTMPPAPVLPKIGACPSGYRTSGDYCLGYEGAKHAIPRTGSCPSGYHASGVYCASFR